MSTLPAALAPRHPGRRRAIARLLAGVEPRIGQPLATALVSLLADETAKWTRVVKAANIKAE